MLSLPKKQTKNVKKIRKLLLPVYLDTMAHKVLQKNDFFCGLGKKATRSILNSLYFSINFSSFYKGCTKNPFFLKRFCEHVGCGDDTVFWIFLLTFPNMIKMHFK
jgi:hypothetical protein